MVNPAAALSSRKQGASIMPARPNKRRRVVCSQTIANKICDGLAAGKTLTALCRDKNLPCTSTVLQWVKNATPIEYDGSEDLENLTGIDKALLEHREHLASVISAAGNKPNGEALETTALADTAQGGSEDKVGQGGVASSLLFNVHYTLARVIGYETLADIIRDIADDDSQDLDADGRANHSAVNRARLRVDSYKWLLAKALPKVYSDHGVKLTVSGGADSNAPDVILTGNDVDL